MPRDGESDESGRHWCLSCREWVGYEASWGGILARCTICKHVFEDFPLPRVEYTIEAPHAATPRRGHPSDAGYDLTLSENTTIPPATFLDLPTGIRICQPPGFWCRIVGRSSTFRTHRLLVLEGVIDTDYTGDLFVGVYNPSESFAVSLERGTRIAQAIFHRLEAVRFDHTPAESFPSRLVDRGSRGFGSTGR